MKEEVRIITESIVSLEELEISQERKELLKQIDKIDSDEKDKKIYLENFCGYLTENVLIVPQKIKDWLEKKLNKDIKTAFDALFYSLQNYILKELQKEDLIYALSIANFPVEESTLCDSKILKLLVLLNKKDEIIDALYFILANPHRKLVEIEEYKRFDQVEVMDANILTDILSNPQFLYKTPNGIIEKQYSPIKVLQYNNYETYDTQENRFVKHFLKELDYVLSYELEEFLRLEALQELKSETEFVLNSDIFSEVSTLSYFPSNSQVLMKRTGYRQVFQIYRMLHLAYVPKFFEELDTAFSLKDMATLWEYYVLIRTLKILKAKFGNYKTKVSFVPKSQENTMYEYAEFEFEKQFKLFYQKTLTSYSKLHFRPDILIEKDNKKYILDAKFRIFENNRRDILLNMHYYKDALKVQSAVALSLGQKEENGELYDEKEDTKEGEKKEHGELYHENDNKKENILFKDIFYIFNTNFSGVGHINLTLDEVIKNI